MSQHTTTEEIFESLFLIINKSTNINKEEVISKSRLPHLVDIRRIICGIVRVHHPSIRTKQIGKMINRTHCTVSYFSSSHASFCRVDKDYSELFNLIETEYLISKKEKDGNLLHNLIVRKNILERQLSEINTLIEKEKTLKPQLCEINYN
jgi:hypothetical protein